MAYATFPFFRLPPLRSTLHLIDFYSSFKTEFVTSSELRYHLRNVHSDHSLPSYRYKLVIFAVMSSILFPHHMHDMETQHLPKIPTKTFWLLSVQ